MCSPRDNAALPALGFPIRRSTGHRLLGASPWLIAATHVLHRLLVPRHPPCALPILTVINLPKEVGDTQLFGQLCSFQGPTRRAPRVLRGVVSQNSTACRASGEAVLLLEHVRVVSAPVDIP